MPPNRRVAVAYDERFGPVTPGFTLSVYRHLYDAERKQAALSLDELLGNVPRVVN